MAEASGNPMHDTSVHYPECTDPRSSTTEARSQEGSKRHVLKSLLRSRSGYAGHVTRAIQTLNISIVNNKSKEELSENCAKLVEAHTRFDKAHEDIVNCLEDLSDYLALDEVQAYKEKVDGDIQKAYNKYESYTNLELSSENTIGNVHIRDERDTSISYLPVSSEFQKVKERPVNVAKGARDVFKYKFEQENLSSMRETLNPDIEAFYSKDSEVISNPNSDFGSAVHFHSKPYMMPNIAGNDESSNISKLIDTLQLPRAEIETFTGDPLKYWSFMRSFDAAVGQASVNKSVKLNRLLQCCEGRALKAITPCNLMNPEEGYARALQILYERFGNSLHLRNAWLKKVTDGPILRNNDKIALRDLADDVCNCYETLYAMGQTDGDTFEKAMLVVKRLPQYLQNLFRKEAMTYINKFQKYPGLKFLTGFLDQAAKQANDPLFAILDEKEVKTQGKFKGVGNKTSFNTNVASDSKDFNSTETLQKGVNIQCYLCKGFHHFCNCPTFRRHKPVNRLDFVRKYRLCFNCLQSNRHRVHNCLKPRGCKVSNCNMWHHTLLHDSLKGIVNKHRDNFQGDMIREPVRKIYASSPTTASVKVCLPIVQIRIKGHASNHINALALLDTGSDSTFCSKGLLRELGVKGKSIRTRIDTVNPQKITDVEVTSLEITPHMKNKTFLLNQVYAVDDLPSMQNSVAVRAELNKWSHLADLPVVDKVKEEVKIVVGLDHPHLLKPYEVRRGKFSEPYAIRYALGWAVHGPLGVTDPNKGPISNFIHTELASRETNLLNEQIEKFWLVDGVEDLKSEKLSMSKEDQEVINLWDNTVKKVEGHYELPIPFKRDPQEFCNNKCVVQKRLELLKRRLLRDPQLLNQYKFEINKLFDNGHAEPVPDEELNSVRHPKWYLPMFNVKNPYKPEKFRLVFDCAAQYRGESLNSQVKQGPDLTNKLFGVLLRFRKGAVGIMSDIKSMFYQVSVTPFDRNVLRFLWWPGGDLEKVPVEYRMTVHLFGGVWSPCAATYALRHCAEAQRNGSNDKLIDSVMKDFYVDDLLHTEDSVDDMIRYKVDIINLLRDGGFELDKWATNSTEVRRTFSKDECSTNKMCALDFDKFKIEYALGLQWDTVIDSLSIRVVNKDRPYTRRGLLSNLASVYDPLGMVSPVVVKAKLIFQNECRLGKSWDEKLSDDNLKLWMTWLEELHHLSKFSIPRCIKPMNFSEVKFTLHHFCDASQNAYGAVTYIRAEDIDGKVHCTFLASKSRLAPMKTLSIPRLELAAAVLAVNLDAAVKKEINIPLEHSVFWTDSMLVLQYIRNHSKRFKVYVANRVAQIQHHSDESQWRFVPSQENPADDVSRGMTAQNLVTSQRWLWGPVFLWNPKELWPKIAIAGISLDDDPEVNNKPAISLASAVEETQFDELLSRFSSWMKLRKAVCYLKKFVSWLKSKHNIRKDISLEEINEAENCILAYIQRKYYQSEIQTLKDGKENSRTSFLYRLEPFLDGNLLRVYGRLSQAEMPYDTRHPIILPRQHPVTKIIANEIHISSGHGGRESTLASIRNKFWIPKARPLLNEVIRQCSVCTRYKAVGLKQRMADLPEKRLMPGKAAFTNVGVDCFGPFLVKRGRAQEKRYGCLFTCFSTRAVHIEMLNNLETDSFINALNRFMCRRGIPETIRSDNGTNFVGAHRELMIEFMKVRESKAVYNYALSKGLKWEYNPPYASHAGGVWERVIRSARNVIYVLIKKQVLDDEKLSTVFCEVESILNSRPLVPVSNDPADLEPITPNHLLLLRHGCDGKLTETCVNDQYGRRWRHCQFIADKFWQRWLKEYLATVQLRSKWLSTKPNIKVGDLVLIMDQNSPRCDWPLGRVIEKYPGKDNLVRTVRLRTANGEVVRPILKLCLLEGVHLDEVSD